MAYYIIDYKIVTTKNYPYNKVKEGSIWISFKHKLYTIDDVKKEISYSSNIPFEAIIGLYVKNGDNYRLELLYDIFPPIIYVKIPELYNQLNQNITNVQNDYTNLKGQYDTLKNSNTQLTNDLSSLSSKYYSLERNYSSLQTQ